MTIAAAVYEDCTHFVQDFMEISFNHIPREANQVAHEMAKMAKFLGTASWLETPPPAIVPFLIRDVNLFAS